MTEMQNNQQQLPPMGESSPQQPQAGNTMNATPHKKNNQVALWVGAAVLVVFCMIAGFGGAGLYTLLFRPGAMTQHQKVAGDGNAIVTPGEEDVASIVEKVAPSVVSIVTKSQAQPYSGALELEGAGTGMIVSQDGYVLTNKHVVDGASMVGVVLTNGTSYNNVKVLGVDPLNDVAFLKIEGATNLPAVEMGDSSTIRVGQKVVAIGNSLGQYQNTVTSGIISGVGRPVAAQAENGVETLTDLIQTDAAINPGNSGGPLLNVKGQVIGINTAIAQDAQGIGFAIPINATKGILKGVLHDGTVKRAYLGVNFIAITPDVAVHYSLPVKTGAYVLASGGRPAVAGGSPAAKAGVQDKDIIVKVGGVDVGDKAGLSSLIAEYAPGDTIQLSILRAGKTIVVTATLALYGS